MKKIILSLSIISFVAAGCNTVPPEQTNIDTSPQTVRTPIPQSKMEIKAANSSEVVNQSHIMSVEVVDAGIGSALQIQLNEEGTRIFAKITTDNIGNEIPITVDGELISSPTVQNPITTGDFVVTSGNWNKEQAQAIKEKLQGYKEEQKS